MLLPEVGNICFTTSHGTKSGCYAYCECFTRDFFPQTIIHELSGGAVRDELVGLML